MKQNIIPVESIKERDIDIILLEELSTDISFCKWFTSQLLLPRLTLIDIALRSISDFGLGETDLFFSYFSGDHKIFILIENKLDANFQKEQFNRYQSRAQQYINNNVCDDAYCVLIAPKDYCKNQNEFEKYLTYEDIAIKLEKKGTKRSLFKSKLFQIGVEKLRRGYQPINSIPVQNFWLLYWGFKEKFYPNFYMKKPTIVPHNSDWPMLFDGELPKIVFYHKLAQGNVDATFNEFDKEAEFNIKNILPEWIKFQKHNKAFSLRIFVEKTDRFSSFNSQLNSVKNGLDEMYKLRNWILVNKKFF